MRTGQILYVPKIGQRANFQHPLVKGCVGWWPLTDGGGGIAKDLVRGNNGIQSGGVTWADTEKGRVASFDDTDDRINVGDVYDPGTGSLSMSMWFSKDDTGAAEKLINYGTASGDSSNWIHIGWSAGNAFSYSMDDGTAAISLNSANTYDDGDWYHVVCTYDTTDMKTYINGVLDTSVNASTMGDVTDATQKWKIGAMWDGATYTQNFGGDIQNVRIWDRALSDSEVLELYQNPWAGLSMPSATRYFFVPQLITASPKLFNISGSSVSMKSNAGRVSVRAAR